MSRQGYATPLRLEPRRPPLLRPLIVSIHLGALLCIVVAPMPWFLQVPCGLLVIGTGIRELHPRSECINTLVWRADHWVVSCTDGHSFEAELLPATFFTRWLVILHFRRREGGGKEKVVLLPQSLDDETFRRLRVRLRLEGLIKESDDPR